MSDNCRPSECAGCFLQMDGHPCCGRLDHDAPKCKSCGVPLKLHLGHEGQCAELQFTKKALAQARCAGNLELNSYGLVRSSYRPSSSIVAPELAEYMRANP